MFRILCPTPILRGLSSAPKTGVKSAVGSTMINILEEVLGSPEQDRQRSDSDSTIKGIKREGTIISPRSLSPQVLLNPYKPRPRPDLAYPLGPPANLSRKNDFFVALDIHPLRDSAMNPYLKSQFTSSMGKIQNRSKNGLGRKSQRLIGKSVRRARSMGVLPYFGYDTPPSN